MLSLDSSILCSFSISDILSIELFLFSLSKLTSDLLFKTVDFKFSNSIFLFFNSKDVLSKVFLKVFISSLNTLISSNCFLWTKLYNFVLALENKLGVSLRFTWFVFFTIEFSSVDLFRSDLVSFPKIKLYKDLNKPSFLLVVDLFLIWFNSSSFSFKLLLVSFKSSFSTMVLLSILSLMFFVSIFLLITLFFSFFKSLVTILFSLLFSLDTLFLSSRFSLEVFLLGLSSFFILESIFLVSKVVFSLVLSLVFLYMYLFF